MNSRLNKIYTGDCRSIMRKMAAAGITAQTCITSPPYYGLRDYGHEGQLGNEETPEAYIANMVEVFRCVRDVLADNGTLWINIGDSYAGSGKGLNGDGSHSSTGTNAKQATNKGSHSAPASRSLPDNTKRKDLIGIPWMLAFALRADGWYLRSDLIWDKGNSMPEPVKDRCVKSHEYVFMLTKSPDYLFNSNAIREAAISTDTRPSALVRARAFGYDTKEKVVKGSRDNPNETTRDAVAPDTRQPRSVWRINTQPYAGAHFATMPEALAERCMLAGSNVGDLVLDPFSGSGTTAVVAIKNKRCYIGCELNPEYKPLWEERIADAHLYNHTAITGKPLRVRDQPIDTQKRKSLFK